MCIIYLKIYEKMSSGGLEVSLSIDDLLNIDNLYFETNGKSDIYQRLSVNEAKSFDTK